MPDSDIDYVEAYFKSKHSHVSRYWIECCMDWYRQLPEQYKIKPMRELIYEQWLLSDLREIAVRCLPPNLCNEKKKKKFILNASFVVQIMYLKDISKASLAQLRKIRDMYKLTRTVIDNENETCDKRVLYLNLTDGVDFINAFEYETVQCLNINLTPGAKLLLIGPLLIRNGEILLKNGNVKVLGGQVDELLITNAAENVLARELNLPENPNPYGVDSEVTNNLVDDTVHANIINQGINIEYNGNNNNNSSSSSSEIHITEASPVNPTNSTARITYSCEEMSRSMDQADDDDIFANIDIDAQLDKIEKEQVENTNQATNFSGTSFQGEWNPFISSGIAETSSNIDEEIEMLEQIKSEMQEQCGPALSSSPVTTSEPFVYIRQLLHSSDNIKPNQKFKLRAQFVRVIEKITLKVSRGWNTKFEISDGTDVLTVDFDSEIIEELMDMSTAEVLAEKNKFKTKNMNAFEKVLQGLVTCRKKLHSFNGIIHIQYAENKNIPTVIKLQPLDREILEKLKNRTESVQIKLS